MKYAKVWPKLRNSINLCLTLRKYAKNLETNVWCALHVLNTISPYFSVKVGKLLYGLSALHVPNTISQYIGVTFVNYFSVF